MYMCIDMKSFYASVECVTRHLNPDTAPIVVADVTRGKGALCLAVSAGLKAMGVKNRCRLNEIPAHLPYWIARPRMRTYLETSAEIYNMYLDFFSPDDVFVYSIDECFINVTPYLSLYHTNEYRLAKKILALLKERFGLTATVGIGPNLFLTKVALDILSKHDSHHIGYVDEKIYRESLWEHTPITDFWSFSQGTQKRLLSLGITTMKGITQTSYEELYKLFGIKTSMIIERAWGREGVTLDDIKAYVPQHKSLSTGQTLSRGYTKEEGLTVLKELIEILLLKITQSRLCASSVSVIVVYDQATPHMALAVSQKLTMPTLSASLLLETMCALYEHGTKPLMIRRIYISFNNLVPYDSVPYDLFNPQGDKELKLYDVLGDIKEKMGKGSIMRLRDIEPEATFKERNALIGGHHA